VILVPAHIITIYILDEVVLCGEVYTISVLLDISNGLMSHLIFHFQESRNVIGVTGCYEILALLLRGDVSKYYRAAIPMFVRKDRVVGSSSSPASRPCSCIQPANPGISCLRLRSGC
jgi:hypothetical protein